MTVARLILAILFMTSFAWAQREDDVFVGQKAPEITGDRIWINTPPLKLESLRGKVVLIEFWAFDCPECAKAMPHIMEMNEKYSKQGLVVIGVHTPRIDKEKDVEKIKEAVKTKGIKYPVVVDNNYGIWSDYACDAWPMVYIVDQEGVIQLSHTGIGRYEDMEKVVQKLLAKKQ
jgi:thiol-disulfide isomerase/thioredoxin